jgi:hypothetical protein
MFHPITNESYFNILQSISDLFLIKLKIINRKNNKSYYRIETVKKSSILKLINYFDKFPLLGRKRFDYYLWKEAFLIYNDNQKMNEIKLEKIQNLKANMNRSRKNNQINFF